MAELTVVLLLVRVVPLVVLGVRFERLGEGGAERIQHRAGIGKQRKKLNQFTRTLCKLLLQW